MIQLVEHAKVSSAATEHFRDCFDALLEKRWKSYRKALKRTRKKFSEEAVHDLRVELRRLQSALGLLTAALPGGLVAPVEAEVKARLKVLSSLRDTQVQLLLVGKLREKYPVAKPYLRYLDRREKRLVKNVGDALKKTRTNKLARQLTWLESLLDERLDSPEHEYQEASRVVAAVEEAYGEVLEVYHQIEPDDIATIHRVRLAFKKFRYMVEALAQVLPGITGKQIGAMHLYQSRMGDIQDLEVLVRKADKFAAKHKVDPDQWRPFQEAALRRRKQLVKRYLRTGDQLMKFWPPTPPAAASRSRSAPFRSRSPRSLLSA